MINRILLCLLLLCGSAHAEIINSSPINLTTSAVDTFSAGTTGLTPNTATSGAVTLAGTLSVANGGTGQTSLALTPQGRLTLTSNTPVMSADVTAATSVYYAPYVGNIVPIYNGTNVIPTAISQLTLALDSVNTDTGYQQSGKLFDLFIANNAGTIVLCSGPAWTSNTARGRGAGTTQINQSISGLWTNTNAMTCRWGSATANTLSVPANNATYVGTMYATANGQTAMQFAPAGASGGSNNMVALYNAYNRINLSSTELDSTASENYTTAAWRALNNNNNNRITWVDGLGQSPVQSNVVVLIGSTGAQCYIGQSLDAVSTPSSPYFGNGYASGSGYSAFAQGWKFYQPALGLHFVQAMEFGGTAATFYLSGSGDYSLTIKMDI